MKFWSILIATLLKVVGPGSEERGPLGIYLVNLVDFSKYCIYSNKRLWRQLEHPLIFTGGWALIRVFLMII